MKRKRSQKKNNTVSVPIIGADTNHTTDALLKDGERTGHEETILPHAVPHSVPHYKKEELNVALVVIRKIMNMEGAEPFNTPVNPIMLEITDYFDVIDTPMDFGTIRRNLEKGVKYMNSEDVFNDVCYIWQNCYKYNKASDPILELVNQVKEKFLMFWTAAGLYYTRPMMANGHSVLLPTMDIPLRRSPRFSVGPTAKSLRDQSNYSQPKQLQPSFEETQPSKLHIGDTCLPPSVDAQRKHHRHKIASGRQDQPTSIQPKCQQAHQRSNLDQLNSNQPHQVLSPQPISSDPLLSPSESDSDSGYSALQHVSQPESGSDADYSGPSREQNRTRGQGSSSRRKRTRGPTYSLGLLRLNPGIRITPQWNEHGELIQQERGKKLSTYLGTLVRCQSNVPLQFKGWPQVPNEAKEKLWGLVLEKFDIDDEHKHYVMRSMGSKYRSYRHHLKAAYYDPYSTKEERLRHCPPNVSDDDWSWLVNYWGTPKAQAASERNKACRSKQVYRHTSGSKSYAQLRHEQMQMREDGTGPNQIEMFVLTHTRKDGTPVDNASRDIMFKFQELSTQQPGGSPQLDVLYTQVMGSGRHGRGRGYRVGPTPTSIYGSSSRREEALVTELASVKEQLTSVSELLEKQRKELEEIKAGGMASQKQQMQEWIQEQMMKMKDEIIQQFQHHMQQQMMQPLQ